MTRAAQEPGPGRPEGERGYGHTEYAATVLRRAEQGMVSAGQPPRAATEQAGGEAGAEPEKADRAERSGPVVGMDHENDFAAHSWESAGCCLRRVVRVRYYGRSSQHGAISPAGYACW